MNERLFLRKWLGVPLLVWTRVWLLVIIAIVVYVMLHEEGFHLDLKYGPQSLSIETHNPKNTPYATDTRK